MTLALLALMSLPMQGCSVSLPFPTGPFALVGDGVAASDRWVVSSGGFNRSLHVWSHGPSAATTLDSELTPASGERIFGFDVDGDRIVVASSAPSNGFDIHVWERDSGGTWVEGPALPAPANRLLTPPVFVEGDTIVAASSTSGFAARRIPIWDRDAATGLWNLTEDLDLPGLASPMTAGLADGRIFATTDTFSSNAMLHVIEPTGLSYAVADSFGIPDVRGKLVVSGDRVAVPQRSFSPSSTFVEIWKRDSSAWSLEQRIPAPDGLVTGDVALGDRWLAIRTEGFQFSPPTPRPVQVYRRPTGSSAWLEVESALPPGGLDSSSERWAESMAIVGETLFVTDETSLPVGQVIEVDLGCLQTPSPFHWVPAELVLEGSTNWPSGGERLEISTGLPFPSGRPYGLRNASISVLADYDLSIRALPCASAYLTSICANGAYNLRDSSSSMGVAPFPLDPSGGVPQFYAASAGPLVPASTTEVVIPWSFTFAGTDTLMPPLIPTGQPLDIELFAQSYNCVDSLGTWFPDIPNVQGTNCGYELLPTTLLGLSFEASVTGEVAFVLPSVAPGAQGTGCPGSINGVGLQAELEAVGSNAVLDDALFVSVSGLAPGTAGLLFLSPVVPSAPFQALGFGTLCLGTPFLRAPGSMAIADASGNATAGTHLSALPPAVRPQPGSTWAMQWMYRDQGAVNTSSARSITFQ